MRREAPWRALLVGGIDRLASRHLGIGLGSRLGVRGAIASVDDARLRGMVSDAHRLLSHVVETMGPEGGDPGGGEDGDA